MTRHIKVVFNNHREHVAVRRLLTACDPNPYML